MQNEDHPPPPPPPFTKNQSWLRNDTRVDIKALTVQLWGLNTPHLPQPPFAPSVPTLPQGFSTITFHLLAVKAWGGGATFARLYHKNACPLHRRPVFEPVGSVNRGEDGHAGFSFSFSHTNDVVPDHSCSPRGRCASGSLGLCRPGSRPCQKQDGRRGDGAHSEAQK